MTVRALDGSRLNVETPPTVFGTANVTPCAFGSPASSCWRLNAHTCGFWNDCVPVLEKTFADM